MPWQEHRLRHQRWVPIILVVGLAGYPLLGTVVVLSQLPSLAASIPVRLLVALASALMLATAPRLRLSPIGVTLWAFWLIYLARLLWDWLVVSIPGADEALLFFTVTCLLPAAALLRYQPHASDEPALARLMLLCGLSTCLLALTITLADLAPGRSLFAETERLSFDTVNPITYGHVAASTVIAAISTLLRRDRRGTSWISVMAILAAAATLQLSASRGPALALAVCLIAVGIFHSRLRWGVFLIAALTVFLVVNAGTGLEDRFRNVEDDPSTLERILVQSNAIAQFLDHPLTGSAYIEKELEIYPHNPIIESAMATGVVGLSLFTIVATAVLWKAIRQLRRGFILLPLLALQYLIGSMLSGALYASTQMWITFALMIAMTQRPRVQPHRKRLPAPVSSPAA